MRIIEQRKERCEYLSEMLPGADIINGDGSDKNLLLEEGLTYADSMVALTGLDEENIFLALFAKKHSNAKLVAKVNKIAFNDVIDSFAIDSVVYPKYLTADYILQYVRACQNTIGSNVETLYNILDGRAEALEFSIREASAVTDVPLMDLCLLYTSSFFLRLIGAPAGIFFQEPVQILPPYQAVERADHGDLQPGGLL